MGEDLRYECDDPRFAGAYLQMVKRGWMRRELRELRTLAESDEWFALLRRKVVGLHLPAEEGEAIDTPDALTPDALDRLDLELYNWFVATLVLAMSEVGALGNAVWRRLFATPAATDATEPQTA